ALRGGARREALPAARRVQGGDRPPRARPRNVEKATGCRRDPHSGTGTRRAACRPREVRRAARPRTAPACGWEGGHPFARATHGGDVRAPDCRPRLRGGHNRAILATMTDADTKSAQGSPFWRFSLQFYRQPKVADACIALQEGAGVDVNLLLFLLWHAAQ